MAASTVILAPETITSADAAPVMKRMPLEKTNLWPRAVSRLGRNPSFAITLTIFGNAL